MINITFPHCEHTRENEDADNEKPGLLSQIFFGSAWLCFAFMGVVCFLICWLNTNRSASPSHHQLIGPYLYLASFAGLIAFPLLAVACGRLGFRPKRDRWRGF